MFFAPPDRTRSHHPKDQLHDERRNHHPDLTKLQGWRAMRAEADITEGRWDEERRQEMADFIPSLPWPAIHYKVFAAANHSIKEGWQFVGQHLVNPFEPPRLTYWLREAKSANAEVDYVTANANRIIPIEVKAGKSGAIKSLQQFALSKKATLCVRFDLNPPDIQHITHAVRIDSGSIPVSYTLMSLPLYMVAELPRILDEIRMGK